MSHHTRSARLVAMRRPNNAGWVVLAVGWLLVLLAAALLLVRKDGSSLYAATAGVGAICAAIGGFLAGPGRPIWMAFPGVASGFLLFAGFMIASPALDLSAHGQPVTCQVMNVREETRETTSTDLDGERHTEVSTVYVHSMRCPSGTSTVTSGASHPVGERLSLVQVPGKQPEFESANGTVGLGIASAGGLIALVATVSVWVRRRRWAAAIESAQHFPATPAYPHPGGQYPGAGPAGPAPGPYPPGGGYPGQPGNAPYDRW